jgi:DNA-binding NarL/FixJ family response regulator
MPGGLAALLRRAGKRETAPVTAATPIRVVLCDDHVLVRQGLQRVMEGAGDVEVVAHASDGEEAVDATLRLQPDVVLMDLVMPGVDGVEATRRIAASDVDAKVLVLTSFADDNHVFEALDAGASGYLLKDAPPRDVVRAVRAAAAGQSPLDPRAARLVVARQVADDPRRHLTEREREILDLIADGLATKVIARRLGIAEPTVRKHLTSIYRQIGVTDRTQAALWAVEHGMGTK